LIVQSSRTLHASLLHASLLPLALLNQPMDFFSNPYYSDINSNSVPVNCQIYIDK